MNETTPLPFSRRAGMRAAAALGLGALGVTPATAHQATPGASTSHPEAPGLNRETFLAFMQMVGGRMEETGVPAVVVGAVHNGIRSTCGLGSTNRDDPSQASAQTFFRVASLTSLFTASALASLVDDGAIALDEPVRTYLPTFRVRDEEASDAVLVRHLLTHTAGWQGDVTMDAGSGDDALSKYVEAMADLQQVSRPGEHLGYSASSVILAGHLVAEVTGQSFETAVRDLVLSPLSMDRSTFTAADLAGRSVAFGHVGEGDNMEVVEPWEPVRATAPMTGLLANTDELLSFTAFHANTSTAKPAGYLSTDAWEQVHSALGPGGSVGPLLLDAMGLSWMRTTVGGAEVSVHAGNDVGQSSMIAVVPSEGFGVVVLTNADRGRALSHELVMNALDHFLVLRDDEPEVIAIADDELDAFAGTYAVVDGPLLTVAREDAGLRLDVEMDGAPISGESGAIEFVAPDRARLRLVDETLYLDFVRDGEEVAWIRHRGQLASRANG